MLKGKVLTKKTSEKKKLDMQMPSSPDTIENEDLFIESEKEEKRSISEEDTDETKSDQENAELELNKASNSNMGNEMSKMLEMLESDLNKSMLAKKRKIETFTNAAININQSKLMKVWNTQHANRKCLLEEFATNSKEILKQCEADLIRQEEQEEKVQRIVQQHAKVVSQARAIHRQMISSIREIYKSLEKSIENLETKDMEQIESMKDEMRQEMILLQKRTLMENQQQDMKNVRKSLQHFYS